MYNTYANRSNNRHWTLWTYRVPLYSTSVEDGRRILHGVETIGFQSIFKLNMFSGLKSESSKEIGSGQSKAAIVSTDKHCLIIDETSSRKRSTVPLYRARSAFRFVKNKKTIIDHSHSKSRRSIPVTWRDEFAGRLNEITRWSSDWYARV